MAVTSRELHAERRVTLSVPQGNVNSVAYIITGILAILAIYVILSGLVSWGQVLVDDLRYGRPRTFHLTANVGRPEERSAPTHLIAMNLDRQVVILEIPGGDSTKTRSLPGPYLFGSGEDLTPVILRLDDMNGDRIPDLIVRVKDEEMVYANRDGSFSLITAEERQQLIEDRR